jgi:Flp pilus assembly protein TadG
VKARILRDRSGTSAVELAIIGPVLCAVLLGIVDGWSLASAMLKMRAAVNAGINYVVQGGDAAPVAEELTLSAWVDRPEDATVTVTVTCHCGATLAACDALCAGSGTVPITHFNVAAGGTWTPPLSVRYLFESQHLAHEQVIRVR